MTPMTNEEWDEMTARIRRGLFYALPIGLVFWGIVGILILSAFFGGDY